MSACTRFLSALAGIAALGGALGVVRAVNRSRYGSAASLPAPGDMEAPQYRSDDDVAVRPLSGHYVRGFLLTPRHPGPSRGGLAIIFGGSEGGVDFDRARRLAGQGHDVMALFFWAAPGQQPRLANVPVDFFDEALDMARDAVASIEPLTVIGTSKGAELALVLAEHYDQITNLVLFSPTTHRWQGLDFRSEPPSWTYRGQPLACLGFRDAAPAATGRMLLNMLLGLPISHRATYESVAERSAGTREGTSARIRTERFGGNVLVLAGDDDRMWPAERAAQELAAAFPDRAEIHVFPGAGHIFDQGRYAQGIELGGSSEANRAALEASEAALAAASARWHP